MRTRSRLVFGIVGFLLAVAVAQGTDDEFWKSQASMRFTATSYCEEESEPATVVELIRGPLIAGTVDLSATIKVLAATEDEYGTLLRIRLLAADDDNENGIIEESEKSTVVSSDAGTVMSGWRTAETGDVTVSAFHDWYRLVGGFFLDGEEFEYGNTVRFHGVTD